MATKTTKPDEPILLHLRNNERSSLFIPTSLYERNKQSYDKVGYILADKEAIKRYLIKRGMKVVEEVVEDEKEVKQKEKKVKQKVSTENESVDD